MKSKFSKKQFLNLPLMIFLALYLLFTIADLSTSHQSGYRDADRSIAHRYLLLVTGYLLVYVAFHLSNLKLRQPLSSLIMLAIWTIFINVLNGVSTWTFLVQANMSVLWILSYVFFERIRLKEGSQSSLIKVISIGLAIFYAVATIYYFFDMMIRLNRIPVLNVVYFGVALLPWIMIDVNPKYKKWIILVSIVIVFFSMKRGAIISLPIMLLSDSFVEGRIKGSNKGFTKILLLVIAFVIAISIADNLTNGFISQRFSADELASGSGRSEQYSTILSLIENRRIIEFLFGSGCERAVQVLGTGVHNEWLSFLFCYGLIGALIYAGLVIGFIKKSFTVLNVYPDLAYPCFMMTALYLVLSMVSTGYGGYVGFWLFGFWGYLNAELDIRLNSNSARGGNYNEVVQRGAV